MDQACQQAAQQGLVWLIPGESLQHGNIPSRVLTGPTAEVIVQEAEKRNVDLIVIGSHAGSALKTAWLGSTARKVTLVSKIPVLVVPIQKDRTWKD